MKSNEFSLPSNSSASLSPLASGAVLLKKLKAVDFLGITGVVKFNALKNRAGLELELLNVRSDAFVAIARYE